MSTRYITLESPVETSKATNVALWVFQIGAAAMFLMAGANKFAGSEQVVGLFEALHLGQWFRYFTGALEVGGALLLLIPALSGVGALLLSGVMIGAVATHLFIIGGDSTMAFVLLVTTIVIAVGRRQQTLKLIGRK